MHSQPPPPSFPPFTQIFTLKLAYKSRLTLLPTSNETIVIIQQMRPNWTFPAGIYNFSNIKLNKIKNSLDTDTVAIIKYSRYLSHYQEIYILFFLCIAVWRILEDQFKCCYFSLSQLSSQTQPDFIFIWLLKKRYLFHKLSLTWHFLKGVEIIDLLIQLQ